MGYDLYITRRKDWSTTGHDITPAEWLAYVARDPELSLWSVNGPYMARWRGKCTYPDPWLDWFQRNVYTKNSDEALIVKMIRIAEETLRVQGDDGEIYRKRRVSLFIYFGLFTELVAHLATVIHDNAFHGRHLSAPASPVEWMLRQNYCGPCDKYSIALFSTSSFPARTPARVGRTSTSGCKPRRCSWRPSAWRTPWPLK